MKKKIISLLSLSLLFTIVGCGQVNNSSGGANSGFVFDDEDPYVTNLRIVTPPTKLVYREGESFDSKGAKLEADWSHGIVEELLPGECNISPKGELTRDVTKITFTYEGKSCTQAITVEGLVITSLSVDRSLVNTKQLIGEVDLSKLIVKATFEDGKQETIDWYKIYEGDKLIENRYAYKLTEGVHTLTVKVGDKEFSFTIEGYNGYTIDATKIVYSEILEANRDQYIGTNFLENPWAAIYDSADPATRQPVTNSSSGIAADGTNKSGYYRAGKEQGVACLQDVKNGHVMRFHIFSEKADRVDLYLNAASCLIEAGDSWTPTKMGDMQFNKLFTIEKVQVDATTNRPVLDNGNEIKTPINIADEVILPGAESASPDMSLWANFVTIPFGEVDLQKGDNIIELKVISEYKNYMNFSCSANVAGFEVRFID